MSIKKSSVILFSTIFLFTASTIISPSFAPDSVLATSIGCPFNTEYSFNDATLVGTIDKDGGDPNLEVWFEYGRSGSFGYETSHRFQYGVGDFCEDVFNLQACTTYYYRAVASNSAGVSKGEQKSFTTRCFSPVSVDLKVNNSDGPITRNIRDTITLSWNSENADFCTASGDWFGSKQTSGSQSIQLNNSGTRRFQITCENSLSGTTDTDSVQVFVNAINPPTVITRPAIITL